MNSRIFFYLNLVKHSFNSHVVKFLDKLNPFQLSGVRYIGGYQHGVDVYNQMQVVLWSLLVFYSLTCVISVIAASDLSSCFRYVYNEIGL